MKTKILLTILLFLGLICPVFTQTDMSPTKTFLDTAVSCDADDTLVNGTDFDSNEIKIAKGVFLAVFEVTFTRDTGTASDVVFYFQASRDNAVSWSTSYVIYIDVDTNEEAVDDVVRYYWIDFVQPYSHIRLWKIDNEDDSTDLTLCNVKVNWKG